MKLAATCRGLCNACSRTKANSILAGCPLLLQLWSFECFGLGRPLLDDMSPYGPDMYPGGDVDRPTMGSIWCRRRVQFAHVQVTRAYLPFVEQIDRLTGDDMRWEPYSQAAVEDRAPDGLSSLCWRDRAFWLTRWKLVYDSPQRVTRQFGLCQAVSVPIRPALPPPMHAKGVKRGTEWTVKMQGWVPQWDGALDNVVDEDRPYDSTKYTKYLRWYQMWTCTRLVHVVDPPPHTFPLQQTRIPRTSRGIRTSRLTWVFRSSRRPRVCCTGSPQVPRWAMRSTSAHTVVSRSEVHVSCTYCPARGYQRPPRPVAAPLGDCMKVAQRVGD